MRTSRIISQAGWAVAAALVLCASGCGSTTESNAAAHARKSTPKAKSVLGAAERQPSDMVAAVSLGKAGPPVELKFELREAPEVGHPLDVDLALLPDSPGLEHVYAKFQAGEGLELVDGGELATADKPPQGVPIRHTVRVLPKRDGIFTLNATVGVDSETESLTRTFSIPVIAGSGLPELAAKSEVAEGPAAPATGSKTH